MTTAQRSRNTTAPRCKALLWFAAVTVMVCAYFGLTTARSTSAAEEKTPTEAAGDMDRAAGDTDRAAGDMDRFDDRVAPILVQNCLHCHNDSQTEGNLNLSTREHMLAGGDSGEAIEPGSADDSYLIDRVRDHEMPPEGKGKPLADADVAALAAWVNAGAQWPKGRTLSEFDFTTDRRAGRDWWSLSPPKRPEVPAATTFADAPQSANAAATNVIDRFVRAKLAERPLAPSAEADRQTLIRRAYFDLVGLPPTPEEIAAFVADDSPDAFERLVDRLLASPHYGERWARHWLDVARFGETSGYEVNTPRENAWPYRDYVIQSLNEDKPYDRFVKEQLAGDQMGAGVATAFIVGGPKDLVGINNVEGQRQQRLDDLDDMISTTGSAFLGMTLGCAKCHNHKFDPVSQEDYYRFAAVFAGVAHGDRPVESLDYERRAKEAPQFLAQLEDIDKRLSELDRRIDALGERLATIPSTSATPAPIDPAEWRPAVNSQRNVDRFAPVTARFVRFTIEDTNASEPCIDELEVFTAGDHPRNVALASAGAKATASGVYANGTNPIHQLAHVSDGQYGNSRSWISNENGRGWVQIELAQPAVIDRVVWGRDRELKFRDRTAIKYRIDIAEEPGAWLTVASEADRRPFDPNADLAAGRDVSRLPPQAAEEYRRLSAEKAEISSRLPKPTMPAFAGTFTSMPAPTYRLNRGDVMQRREEVGAGGLTGVGAKFDLPTTATDAQRRRGLAEWIADPNHPLTARVVVNRLWHYHFGQGLVLTPSNFGFLGGKPSHPALLDWLATELVERGWSLKAMHRTMVTSATWRQASAARDDAMQVDAQCRLLWRYPPQRLEAEPIRDTILSICGTLDLRMGGPGYSVFEPNDNYVRVYTPKQNFGPAEWRRMIYQTKPRMEQDATFGVFDCPDASASMPRRNASTTSLQALSLFNSEFIVQQAGYFAQRLRREAGDDVQAQIARAFVLAFGRPAETEEAAAATQLARQYGLESVCRAILNASELVYVN